MRDFENEGGPAFGHGDRTHGGDPGMSLRDWFAGQADVPWNAVIEGLGLRGEKEPKVSRVMQYRAELKYIEADAMLLARTKPTP